MRKAGIGPSQTMANAQRPSSYRAVTRGVSPEVIFDTNPGDIFVMRNIANIIPPFELSGQYHGTSAALDFAVRRLEVKHVVVLGHSNCGGVQAFAGDFNGVSNGEFIGPWLRLIGTMAGRGAASCGCNDLREIEYKSIQNSLQNLRTFPWIASRCDAGTLCLHGVHFDVGVGVLRWFDTGSGDWRIQNNPPLSPDHTDAPSLKGANCVL